MISTFSKFSVAHDENKMHININSIKHISVLRLKKHTFIKYKIKWRHLHPRRIPH